METKKGFKIVVIVILLVILCSWILLKKELQILEFLGCMFFSLIIPPLLILIDYRHRENRYLANYYKDDESLEIHLFLILFLVSLFFLILDILITMSYTHSSVLMFIPSFLIFLVCALVIISEGIAVARISAGFSIFLLAFLKAYKFNNFGLLFISFLIFFFSKFFTYSFFIPKFKEMKRKEIEEREKREEKKV